VPLNKDLADFKTAVAQCGSLIANAHKTDLAGIPVLPPSDQQQITVAAFLNLFIAWETFLESSLSHLMLGSPTRNGTIPIKYVSPPDADAARQMVIGALKFFDYGNHEYVKKITKLFFKDGYPFEPHLSGVVSDLSDIRVMRNCCAHITSTTQTALETLALRILGKPSPAIDVYRLLTAVDPRAGAGGTVFETYRDKLVAVADLISNG